MALYDTIGRRYRPFRRPDPRIASRIRDGLGEARRVLNVGAGAGSYEPEDREVVALELASTMIAQRPDSAAPVVQGDCVRLPFATDQFDASMAVLTVHHWSDRLQGLREMRRVARRRVVVLSWDPAAPGWWLLDYFPDLLEIDRAIFPSVAEFESALGPVEWRAVPIPHDCSDGFLGAYWRRPHRYLDDAARGAISTFARIEDVPARLERLRRDLDDGSWQQKYGEVLAKEELDLGYRLVVA